MMSHGQEVSPVYCLLYYGAGQTLLLNPCCAAKSFLTYITARLEWDDKDTLDLCDMSGNIVGLSKLSDGANVKTLIHYKQTYVPIVLHPKSEDQKMCPFDLLLSQEDAKYTELKTAVKKQMAASLKRLMQGVITATAKLTSQSTRKMSARQQASVTKSSRIKANH